MPILFIDSSNDPELDTWIGDLLRAAAQSASPAGVILTDDAIREVLEKEMPEFLRMWGPVPYRGEALSPDDAARFIEASDDPVIANFRGDLETRGPGRIGSH